MKVYHSLFLILLREMIRSEITQNDSFICDKNKTIEKEKVNDNYCDCEDGTDESLNNSCDNGYFICKNTYFYPKNISTNKLNDGICDCCDGSDEYLSTNCSNNCLEKSLKEYEILNGKFKNLTEVVNSYDKKIFMKFFQKKLNEIKLIIYNLAEVSKIYKNYHLLNSYLMSIKERIGEEDYENNNMDIDNKTGLYLSEIKSAKNNIYSHLAQKIEELITNFNSDLLKFKKSGLFQNLEELYIIKEKDSSNYIEFMPFAFARKRVNNTMRLIGTYSNAINNTLYFKDGEECGKLNVKYNTKLKLICGKEDLLVKNEDNSYCNLSYKYFSKIGCNYYLLNEILDQIRTILNE